MSIEALLRFREGSAEAGEAIAVGRHLAECERCAAIAREMFADEAEGSVVAAIDAGGDSLPAAHRLRPPRVLAIAAGIVLVVALGAIVIVTSRNRNAAPAPRQVVAVRPPAGYGRADWDALVHDAVVRGSVALAAPVLATPDMLRGGSEGKEVVMTPSATAVESTRPELSWPEVPGARYVVTISAGDRLLLDSPTLDRTRWTPSRPLPRGMAFEWQVRATRGDQMTILPPAPQPHPVFSVISEAAQRDLDAARTRFPQDHLLLGILAAHDGLRDLARRELERNAKVRLAE